MYRQQHHLSTTGRSAVAATRRRWSRRMLVAVAACVLGLLPGIVSLAPAGSAVVQAAQPRPTSRGRARRRFGRRSPIDRLGAEGLPA